jgi:ribosome-associated heat shock protein Hsp15
LAAQLIAGGKVRVNRLRVVKPSHTVREGDVLTIALRGQVLVLRILAGGVRRGPPPEARLLYEHVAEHARPSTGR